MLQSPTPRNLGSLFALPQPGDYVMLTQPDALEYATPPEGQALPWGRIGVVMSTNNELIDTMRLVELLQDKMAPGVAVLLPVFLLLRMPPAWAEPYEPRALKKAYRLTPEGLKCAKRGGWPITQLSLGASVTGGA